MRKLNLKLKTWLTFHFLFLTEPPALPQGQDSQSSISHWGGSDDEDDGSDQFLANSLKRQQEPVGVPRLFTRNFLRCINL